MLFIKSDHGCHYTLSGSRMDQPSFETLKEDGWGTDPTETLEWPPGSDNNSSDDSFVCSN